MNENTKGTEPRVLSTFVGDDLRDRQIAEMLGGVATRSMMKGGIWSPWVGADAEGREIARLAASNRALREENAALQRRVDGLISGCADMATARYQLAGLLGRTVYNLRALVPCALEAIGTQRAIEVGNLCDEAARAIANIPLLASPDPAPSAETSEAQP